MLRRTLAARPSSILLKPRSVYAYAAFHSSATLAEKVTAELVKKLRKITDAPLGQCKTALEESVNFKII